jgi:precorrin-2 methylase
MTKQKECKYIKKWCTEATVTWAAIQEFIKPLNWLKDVSFLNWSDSSFYVSETYYLKEFNPYRVVLTVGICAVLL